MSKVVTPLAFLHVMPADRVYVDVRDLVGHLRAIGLDEVADELARGEAQTRKDSLP